ncbi:hypothetical protein EVAR_82983_1 [Eumeta japonica]|uniref:Uncharacterized protein n=1 Tax=Eumeta variegata TaxID=151549 RepID=A0A4C1VQS2_EUMVA|nr:hypothetical protein EVAR_82983_1 [Eumeta japonica]
MYYSNCQTRGAKNTPAERKGDIVRIKETSRAAHPETGTGPEHPRAAVACSKEPLRLGRRLPSAGSARRAPAAGRTVHSPCTVGKPHQSSNEVSRHHPVLIALGICSSPKREYTACFIPEDSPTRASQR